MSPPGKKMGVTTKESVVKARRAPPMVSDGLVVELVEGGIAEGGQEDLVDEVGGELAAAAVAEHDLLVLEDGDGAGAEERRDRCSASCCCSMSVSCEVAIGLRSSSVDGCARRVRGDAIWCSASAPCGFRWRP